MTKNQAIVEVVAIIWCFFSLIHMFLFGSASIVWGFLNGIFSVLFITPLAFLGASNRHGFMLAVSQVLNAVFLIFQLIAMIAAIGLKGSLAAVCQVTGPIAAAACSIYDGVIAGEVIYFILALLCQGPLMWYMWNIVSVVEGFRGIGSGGGGEEGEGQGQGQAQPDENVQREIQDADVV